MMPVRYSAMNKTTGTGPSSMMAAIMVTAATCNQNEKLEKQLSPVVPDDDDSRNIGKFYAHLFYDYKVFFNMNIIFN